MGILQPLIALCLCYAISAARLPWTQIEVLSTGGDSVKARFQPVKGVKKYFVSVHIKNLADYPSDFTVKLKPEDLRYDGYHYIEANDVLQAGKLYEIWIAAIDRNYNTVGMGDFYTDCDRYSYQCFTTEYGQSCLPPEELCDGTAQCIDGKDEEKDEYGNCFPTLPQRPTPPPPPEDAPCIIQQKAAIAAGSSDYLSCDQDGSYSVMSCFEENGWFNCYCIHQSTGKKLKVKKDYDPWTHYKFELKCEKLQGKKS